jgi:hypothetical protein
MKGEKCNRSQTNSIKANKKKNWKKHPYSKKQRSDYKF